MECPTDGSTLVMSERSGIEIDYCPQCRGVWLDRGELDKIIERSLQQPAPAPQPAYGTPPPQDQPVPGQYVQDPRAGYSRDRRYEAFSAPSAPSPDDSRYYGQRRGGRRRENWLSELFD